MWNDFWLFLHFLALEEGGDDADTKAHREGVMNQLLVLLNTAVQEQKQLKEECGDEGNYGGGAVAEGLAAIGTYGEEGESSKRPIQKSDSIEYVHGSLGIVPSSVDDS